MNLLGKNNPRGPGFHGNHSYHTEARPRVTVRQIIELAAPIFHVASHKIFGPSRMRHISRTRQAIYAVAAEHGWGYAHIGRVIGVDHSSVITGRRKAHSIRFEDCDFDERFRALQGAVGAYAEKSAPSALISGCPLSERAA